MLLIDPEAKGLIAREPSAKFETCDPNLLLRTVRRIMFADVEVAAILKNK